LEGKKGGAVVGAQSGEQWAGNVAERRSPLLLPEPVDVSRFWTAVYRSYLVILFLEIGDR